MLAMIHFAGWYRNGMEVNFAKELRGEVEGVGDKLRVQARYLKEGTASKRVS